jgi:RimJ/RimL family protein N-acetyltransferase
MDFIDTFKLKSGKEIKFRYPTINDVEILKDYINKISAEQSFILLQGFQHTIKSESNWLKGVLEKVARNECVYLCGFSETKLVACGEVALESEAKSHVGNFGISVDIDFRGQGIGQKMMELIISESIKKLPQLRIIILECFNQNLVGRNLYKKLGFIEYGRLPQGLKRQGQFDDAVYMYKEI